MIWFQNTRNYNVQVQSSPIFGKINQENEIKILT